MPEAVAITGLGVACALGVDRAAVAQAARAGKRPFAPPRRFDASELRVNLAAEVPAGALDIAGRFGRSRLRNTSRVDRLALWCVDDALTQAGLLGDPRLRAAGLFVGASTGGMEELERASRRGRLRLDTLWCYPVWATARRLALTYDIDGPRRTYMTACSSAAHALGIALWRLRRREIDLAVAGGSEALCRLTLAGFGSLGILDPDGPRPFATDRRGICLGEGAAFFTLERLDDARRRGAPILALLAGYGASADAHHMIHPRADGGGAKDAMRAALDDAGVSPSEVDYVNAHGTGTEQNDGMEARAIAELFSARPPRVSSTKSMHGHTLGAAAAVEAALIVLGMTEGFVPPNPGVETPIPELGGARLLTEAAEGAPRVVVSSSFAFGGNNAALVFTTPDREVGARIPPRAPASSRDVVISSGALSCGAGTAADAAGLVALLRGPPSAAAAPFAGLNPHALLGELLGKGVTRRMDELSAATTAVIALACRSAGVEPHAAMASAFGTSFGALDATLRFLQRLFDKGPGLVSPLEFPNLVHNAAAGHASIALGTRGPSVTSCQEELSADDALGALWAGIGAGEIERGVCAGGDLASQQLDEAYRRVRRVFDVPVAHASVVGALVVEAASACDERGGAAWARILASRGQGRHGSVPAAVRLALIDAFGEAAGHDRSHDRSNDRIDVWMRGGVSTAQLAREDEAAHLPALRDAETLTARRTFGNAGGAGAAVLAAGAALIASGGARTVLVTSVTGDGAAWATILAAPRGRSAEWGR